MPPRPHIFRNVKVKSRRTRANILLTLGLLCLNFAIRDYLAMMSLFLLWVHRMKGESWWNRIMRLGGEFSASSVGNKFRIQRILCAPLLILSRCWLWDWNRVTLLSKSVDASRSKCVILRIPKTWAKVEAKTKPVQGTRFVRKKSLSTLIWAWHLVGIYFVG